MIIDKERKQGNRKRERETNKKEKGLMRREGEKGTKNRKKKHENRKRINDQERENKEQENINKKTTDNDIKGFMNKKGKGGTIKYKETNCQKRTSITEQARENNNRKRTIQT